MPQKTTRVFEQHDKSFGGFFDATRILETAQSQYQDIKVIETEMHGRVMLIDGLTMLTDDTHFVYHEMMAHVPLACKSDATDVLVIGGGDGGMVRELVKHPQLRRIVLAELDGEVVRMAKRWFPALTEGLADPRVEVRIGDGAALVAASPGQYDVVIIDSTDICDEVYYDTESASPLATDEFYANLKACLKPGGVVTQVLGSTVFYRESMDDLLKRLVRIWPHFKPMMLPCPFYITGDWTMGLFSVDNTLEPSHWPIPSHELEYANEAVARGALALPNYVRRMLEV
jgi:spermidine synthase